MASRFAVVAAAAILLDYGSAHAQVGGPSISPGPPLSMTSPLGIGLGSRVAPTGIPMGATELATPGVSPPTSGTSPISPLTSSVATCGGIGGSMPQASFGLSASSGASDGAGGSMAAMPSTTNSVFDGGGMTGSASGTCATTGSLAGPGASTSLLTGIGSVPSVGRIGIPMGSTEMGVGGLSPASVALTANPSAPLMTLTPFVVIPNLSAPVSMLGSTVPCPLASPTTGTGIPSIRGVASTFGSNVPTRISPATGTLSTTSC